MSRLSFSTLADAVKHFDDSPNFNLVSIRDGSEPSPGSPCKAIADFRRLMTRQTVSVNRTINHRSGHITIVTPYGWLKFWREPTTTASL